MKALVRRVLGLRQPDPTAKIQTLMGLWLYYHLTGDMRRADKVTRDEKYADAVAMLFPLLRIMVEDRFGKTCDETDLAFFCRRVRRNWSYTIPAPELELVQAMVLQARTRNPDWEGKDHMTMALSSLAIMKEIIADLKYSKAVISNAVYLAEDVMFAWGYSAVLRSERQGPAGEVSA